MRKIESNMVSAIRAGRNWKSGNTEVRVVPEYNITGVYLHGNHIANVALSKLTVTLAGWNTNTTRSRVSALCHAFGRSLGVSNRDRVPYLIGRDGSSTEIGESDWVEG